MKGKGRIWHWNRNGLRARQKVANQSVYARRYGAKGGFVAEDWIAIVEHYAPNDLCLRCGEKDLLTIDHVVPLSEGGTNWPDNLQPLCKSCNSSKNAQTIDYRPDGGEFAKPLTKARKAKGGNWQKVLYIGAIWAKREREYGHVIRYSTVEKRTGIDQRRLRNMKHGYDIYPNREMVAALRKCFYCQPEDIIFDSFAEILDPHKYVIPQLDFQDIERSAVPPDKDPKPR